METQTRSPFHLFDKMMEGFALCEIICDAGGRPCDFRYLMVNQGFESIIGLKREEVVGRTARELFPGIEPMWIETYGRVALQEQSARFVGYLDPLKKHFEVNAYSPQKGQFAAIFLDITESIQQSRLLDHLLNASPDRIYFKDRESRFIRMNHATALSFGLANPREALGKTDADFFGEEHAQQAYKDEQHIIATGDAVVSKEEKENWPDGHITWASSSKFAMRDDSGNIIGIIGISRDITDSKTMIECLCTSEERHRLLVENLNDLVAEIDQEGRFLYVSPNFRSTLGYEPDELIGTRCFDLVHGENLPEALEKFALPSATLVVRNRHKDGSWRWLEINARKFKTAGGEERAVAILRDITDNRRMETSFKESEERYRLLVENSNDLVAEVDGEGRFLYVSPNYLQILGYEPQELLGSSCFEKLDPQNMPEALEKFALPSASLEFRYRHKDGSWRWFETTGRKYKTSGGEEREVLVSRDITGRRESEQRLRQLSQAVEHSPASVVITNKNGNIEYVNPKFTEVSGYTFDEVIGRNPRFLKSGEFSPEQYKNLWDKITAGKEWRGEFHNKKKNGELYWEAASISAIEDGSGKITHFVAVKEDITERKRMEESLRESEALFRTISEASPLGIVLMDENGDTVYVNAAHRRICERTLGEIVGKAWWDVIHPNDRERVIREWDEMRKTGQPFHSERRYVHKDGKIVWASMTAAPVRHKDSGDAAEEVRGYVGITEDITERKRMEEQVLRTQRMESIGTLASGVAHDLNNILSPIMMSVEMLREDMAPQAREDMLTTISECVSRGSEIVGQVLTFARGSQGDRSVLQARHLIKEVAKIAHETFPKSITIANNTSRDLWPVNGDSTQLHQVLMNLAINARDAMPAGGTLTFTGANIELDENDVLLREDAKPGIYTLLEVMDTGGGIPQEIIHKIFDPFFTTKEIGKGTGLGLSTVIGIVRSHGGFVNVYSEVGKGSTFKVYLPAVINAETEGAQKERPAIPGGAGETILLVDDEATILTITGAILSKNGYNVISASNGVEAISLYVHNAAAVKVVLTDLMMPLMDGVNLIRALKKMNPSIKVISTTGQAEESRRAELKTLGVNIFLPKPFATEKLLTALHELIHC